MFLPKVDCHTVAAYLGVPLKSAPDVVGEEVAIVVSWPLDVVINASDFERLIAEAVRAQMSGRGRLLAITAPVYVRRARDPGRIVTRVYVEFLPTD